MAFYQWLVPVICIFYIVRLVKQYRRRQRLFGSTLIWLLFWLAITMLAIIPDLISFNIAQLLGFKSNINAVIFVALGFLYVFMYYMTALIEKLEKQITELVRKLALENQKLKEKLNDLDSLSNEEKPSSKNQTE